MQLLSVVVVCLCKYAVGLFEISTLFISQPGTLSISTGYGNLEELLHFVGGGSRFDCLIQLGVEDFSMNETLWVDAALCLGICRDRQLLS